MLNKLGIEATVHAGQEPQLTATLDSPKGRISI